MTEAHRKPTPGSPATRPRRRLGSIDRVSRRPSSPFRPGLVLAAIVLLAVNLRPAAVSVGPVLDEVRAGLGMSAWEAGLLTALPVLAFSVFGALAAAAASRLGPHRVTLLALVAVGIGLAGRALVGGVAAFLALSMLALAGMALANVLLPSLVRRHFPDRIGTVTALYTTALSVGLTGSFLATVPVADAAGSWRAGLAAWAGPAVLAAAPWVVLGRGDRRPARPHVASDDSPRADAPRFRDLARTRLGIAMAVFFGLQSLNAYAIFGWFATLWRDAGYGAGTASALVAVVAAVSIPLSLWAPAVVARPGDRRLVIAVVVGCYPVAYLGLAVSPYHLALLWALLLGVAAAIFPIALVLIGLRSRTPEATAALSGFSQSVGYLLAAIGPFGTGALHDLSGGWTVPLLVLAALSVPLFALSMYVGRPGSIEDQLTGARRVRDTAGGCRLGCPTTTPAKEAPDEQPVGPRPVAPGPG